MMVVAVGQRVAFAAGGVLSSACGVSAVQGQGTGVGPGDGAICFEQDDAFVQASDDGRCWRCVCGAALAVGLLAWLAQAHRMRCNAAVQKDGETGEGGTAMACRAKQKAESGLWRAPSGAIEAPAEQLVLRLAGMRTRYLAERTGLDPEQARPTELPLRSGLLIAAYPLVRTALQIGRRASELWHKVRTPVLTEG